MHSSRPCVFVVACVLVAAQPAAAQNDQPSQPSENRRPKLVLRGRPEVAITPARVVFTAELTGGADDFEEYYCPTVEWDWGDDTRSESTVDCQPYEEGKSQIRRRFTVEHTFKRAGVYRVFFRLKRRDRAVGTATTNITVRPGARDYEP
jgi:hypothetical protein